MGIYKSKRDGNWFYQFKRNKVCYNAYGFASKQEARDAEDVRLKSVTSGKRELGADIRSISFAKAAEVFYDEHAYKLNHEGDYRHRLPIIVKCPNLQKRLIDVKKDDIKALREWVAQTQKTKKWVNGKLEEQPVKPLTVNHYHAHVKAVFQWWIDEKELDIANPAGRVEMASTPKARVRFLYPGEEKLLTPVIQQWPQMWPYYVTGLETGLRQGNLTQMRVRDVDLVLGQIFIPISKNGESGYIPISDRLRPWIESWMRGKQPEDRLLGTYTPNSVSNRFTLLVREAGLADFNFHCLRHTFAYYHLSRGESIYKVSKLLLHKDVRVTQQHYGHLATADLASVVNGGRGIISDWRSSQVAKADVCKTSNAGSIPACASLPSDVPGVQKSVQIEV